jgi:hypothetical protein
MTKFMIGSTAAFVALMVTGCVVLPESPDSDQENLGIESEALTADGYCPPGPEYPEPVPPPPCLDYDYDGVCDEIDFCLGTLIPEDVPYRGLKPNHFALIDDDLVFDTIIPGGGPERIFTIYDTGGCSCEQILYALGGRVGQYRNGCSYGTMKNWVRFVNGY